MRHSNRPVRRGLILAVLVLGVTVTGCQVVHEENEVITSSVDTKFYWCMLGAALVIAGIGCVAIRMNPDGMEGYGLLLIALVPFGVMWIASGNNWRIDSEGFTTPRLLIGGMKSERIEFSEIQSVVLHRVAGQKGGGTFCMVRFRNGEEARIPRPEEKVETHLVTALRTHGVRVSKQQGGGGAQALQTVLLLALIVPALAAWAGLSHAMAWCARKWRLRW